MIVAGVVVETAPGAERRVSARMRAMPGVTVQGGDGDRRIAALLEVADAAALERLAERLLAEDDEVLGVFPTLVGVDGP